MYKRNYILGLSGDRSLLLEVLQMHGHRIAEIYVPLEVYESIAVNGVWTFRQRYKNPDQQKPDTFADDDARIARMFGVDFWMRSLDENLPSSDSHTVLDYRRLPDKKQVLSSLAYVILSLHATAPLEKPGA